MNTSEREGGKRLAAAAVNREVGRIIEAGRFADGDISPASELATSLERFLPNLLSEQFPEWDLESLDGIFVGSALLEGDVLHLSGESILIRDQTVTPFKVQLTYDRALKRVANVDLSLGVAGRGKLGISGPPCNSPQGRKRLDFPREYDRCPWVYHLRVSLKSAGS